MADLGVIKGCYFYVFEIFKIILVKRGATGADESILVVLGREIGNI
jgi:hypothetical protein